MYYKAVDKVYQATLNPKETERFKFLLRQIYKQIVHSNIGPNLNLIRKGKICYLGINQDNKKDPILSFMNQAIESLIMGIELDSEDGSIKYSRLCEINSNHGLCESRKIDPRGMATAIVIDDDSNEFAANAVNRVIHDDLHNIMTSVFIEVYCERNPASQRVFYTESFLLSIGVKNPRKLTGPESDLRIETAGHDYLKYKLGNDILKTAEYAAYSDLMLLQNVVIIHNIGPEKRDLVAKCWLSAIDAEIKTRTNYPTIEKAIDSLEHKNLRPFSGGDFYRGMMKKMEALMKQHNKREDFLEFKSKMEERIEFIAQKMKVKLAVIWLTDFA